MINKLRSQKSTYQRPLIMGVLNLAPNSFYAASRHTNVSAALAHAQQLIAQGADILDIGAEGTNPNTHPVTDENDELQRLLPALTAIRNITEVPISIDTSKASVMRAAINAGANWINDVRALREPQALVTVAELQVPVVLMHMRYPQGVPLQTTPEQDIISEVKHFLQQRIDACLAAGIKAKNIVIDPGFGGGSFGKTTAQNLQLVKQFQQFTDLGYPVLAGVSRKTFIGDILSQPPEQRLYGSLALLPSLITQGAAIIRVHDVAATGDVINMLQALEQQ